MSGLPAGRITELALALVSCVVETPTLGMRMEREGRYPFVQHRGYSDALMEASEDCYLDPVESPPCLCAHVLRGSSAPFGTTTTAGSYWQEAWTDEALRLLETPRACFEEGLESLALVPIRREGVTMGLFHLGDPETGTITSMHLPRLEAVADRLAHLLTEIAALEASRAAASQVLVADDDPMMRSVLLKMVKHLGYPCTAVGDGSSALEHLREHRIDLLITDLDMPRMGGLELIEVVRDTYGPYGPEIVICSGDARQISAELCRSRRVAAVLNKPFSLSEMREVVTAALDES